MKKLNITWDAIHDSTGYLFSFAKSLSGQDASQPEARAKIVSLLKSSLKNEIKAVEIMEMNV